MTREEFIVKWSNGMDSEQLKNIVLDLDELLSLPPVEGAEEILVKHGFFVMTHKEGSEHVRKAFIEPVIAAMQEFATLHARKMAQENLREELIDFGHAMFPDESLQNIKHYVDTHLKSKEQ